MKVEKTVIHFKNGERAEMSGLHDPFADGCGRLVELKSGDDSQKHSITFNNIFHRRCVIC